MQGLDLISSKTRRRLLRLLKREGPLSINTAMEALDLARTTIREHLLRLEDQDLVEKYAETTGGRGRLSHHYQLTSHGTALFPSRDGELAHELISFLQEQGADDLVLAFFESFWAERTEQVQARLRAIEGEGREARLEVLRSILEDEGFMPEIDVNDDGVTVREFNCPFAETVKRTKLPCRLEAEFFATLFDAAPERVSYIPEGRPACTYAFPSDADVG